MFDYIYKWLENLSGYMLITAMVTQILPNEEYRKYIRFFCGMILIVMLISPLFQMVGIKEEFEQFYQELEYEQMVEELEEASNQVVEYENELE